MRYPFVIARRVNCHGGGFQLWCDLEDVKDEDGNVTGQRVVVYRRAL